MAVNYEDEKGKVRKEGATSGRRTKVWTDVVHHRNPNIINKDHLVTINYEDEKGEGKGRRERYLDDGQRFEQMSKGGASTVWPAVSALDCHSNNVSSDVYSQMSLK